MKHQSITELLTKLRKIVGHFHLSVVAQHSLQKEQKKLKIPKLKLVQDCITRWNATHDIIIIIISVSKNRDAINNCLRASPKTETTSAAELRHE